MATMTTRLLSSLLRLSRELSLSSSSSSSPLLFRHVSPLSRRFNLLSLLFDDLLRSPTLSLSSSSSSVVLCLNEILGVLQRFKALLADLSTWSRTRLILQSDSVSNHFHELTLDLSTLLDILPLNDLDISDDVKDLVGLVRRQCRRSSAYPDQAEDRARTEMLDLIREVEQEIVPDRARLGRVFVKLGLDDNRSCRAEIECLEREIGDKVSEKWRSAMIALVGLMRYAKCVLFGASTPRSESVGEFGSPAVSDVSVPADFRCPISLDLMKDPVVVATGQTYDRQQIARWIASGHATCPKSGQALAHPNLVPNRALKNLIALWCREQNLPFDLPESRNGETTAVTANKAALEAARMTASFLVKKLAASPSVEAAYRVVHELRQLAKTGSEIRAFVGDAGTVPLLVPLLASDDANLQVNAVTALLNLSILDANKKRIMHADGAINGVIQVLTEGATWQAKENAAATVLSLSTVHSYRRRLGQNQRMLAALITLARVGPVNSKKDALAAILSLAGERDNIRRLIDGEVIETAMELTGTADVADEAVGILAAVAKRGGAQEVGAKESVVLKLVRVLKNGSDSGREHAAAALVILCRKVGGGEMVDDLVRVPGIEWIIWELMGSGTERGRRKAASLGRICRRWAVAAEEAESAARAARFTVAISAAASTMAQV